MFEDILHYIPSQVHANSHVWYFGATFKLFHLQRFTCHCWFSYLSFVSFD